MLISRRPAYIFECQLACVRKKWSKIHATPRKRISIVGRFVSVRIILLVTAWSGVAPSGRSTGLALLFAYANLLALKMFACSLTSEDLLIFTKFSCAVKVGL